MLSFSLAVRLGNSMAVAFIGVFLACLPIGLVYFWAHRARRRIEVEGDRIRYFEGRGPAKVDELINSVTDLRSVLDDRGDVKEWIIELPGSRLVIFDSGVQGGSELALLISGLVGKGWTRIADTPYQTSTD